MFVVTPAHAVPSGAAPPKRGRRGIRAAASLGGDRRGRPSAGFRRVDVPQPRLGLVHGRPARHLLAPLPLGAPGTLGLAFGTQAAVLSAGEVSDWPAPVVTAGLLLRATLGHQTVTYLARLLVGADMAPPVVASAVSSWATGTSPLGCAPPRPPPWTAASRGRCGARPTWTVPSRRSPQRPGR